MGILDALKKLFPSEPAPPWDPQCVRDTMLTIRLPLGWRFTKVEPRQFAATGPGCSLSFVYFGGLNAGTSKDPRYLKPQEAGANRSDILKLVRMIFKVDPKEIQGPDGVMWLEAADDQGKNKRLQIALLNTRPRDPSIVGVPILHVTCTVPSTAAGDVSSQRFEVVRSVLRTAEWN